jgi:hypothetical protein
LAWLVCLLPVLQTPFLFFLTSKRGEGGSDNYYSIERRSYIINTHANILWETTIGGGGSINAMIGNLRCVLLRKINYIARQI